MKTAKLEDMFKGWFVGNFEPSAHKTDSCEVAVKSYKAGEKEASHFHKVATEITLVLSGRVLMCGKEWSAGDVIVLEPGEVTDFEALTDAVNVVVKTPGASNDKYVVDASC
ncbi:cupin domain-containing protein [Zoogloea sp.]|uniref:cupin domain-containing protein n=1 Tax=Zoogloea sp. TaxID=49181 RepID=UPI0035B02BE7